MSRHQSSDTDFLACCDLAGAAVRLLAVVGFDWGLVIVVRARLAVRCVACAVALSVLFRGDVVGVACNSAAFASLASLRLRL